METSFKTRLFGGFDREDVISYIEKTAQKHREALEALQTKLQALQQEQDALLAEQETLRGSAERNSEAARKFDELRIKADELSRRAETLAAENESLRSDANEYRKVKDHIAEIEISAHRRTEEFRARAIAQLHELTQRYREWCEGEQARMSAIHGQMQQQIDGARQALGDADFSGFSEMLESLDRLDKTLDE